MEVTASSVPASKACQFSPPVHMAMWLALVRPAMLNRPPAYRLLPFTCSAVTSPLVPPSPDQVVPFHTAILLLGVVKCPPAYTLLPSMASAMTLSLLLLAPN